MLVILSIVAVVLLISLFSTPKTCRLPWTHFAVLLSLPFVPLTAEQTKIDGGRLGHSPNPITTPQASSVPPVVGILFILYMHMALSMDITFTVLYTCTLQLYVISLFH